MILVEAAKKDQYEIVNLKVLLCSNVPSGIIVFCVSTCKDFLVDFEILNISYQQNSFFVVH